MTAAAEHALRTLAEEMDAAAEGLGAGQGYSVMRAMAVAHRATANRLQAEREEREAAVAREPGATVYDPRPKRAAGRGGRNRG